MFIINDSTKSDLIYPKMFGRGYDQSQVTSTGLKSIFGDAPDQLKVIPRHEWSARIKEMEGTQSSLADIRKYAANGQQMPTLDQNGQGYCWAYSVTRAVMYQRAIMNQPYKRLSAHAVACMVKGFRDEGGWCGLSLEFIRRRGVPSVDVWPEKSMNRANDKPAVWENAAENIITEGWYDANVAVYDQQLSFDQMFTLLLLRIPVAADFNWWGHSVNLHTPREVEPGSFCPEGDNSWTDGWGELGSFVLQGQKAIPDGAVAIRVINASCN